MFVKIIKHTLGRIALYSVLSLSFVAIFVVALFSRVSNIPSTESIPASVNSIQSLTTDTWGIFDPQTGKITAGNNVDVARPIASVTKLFTAETVLTSTKKNAPFFVSYADLSTEGRSGKLYYGEKVTPYSLLFPLLLESSNDAAVAIQRELGDEFTSKIFNLTTELSLTNTHISEPSGLSPKNISTVEDLSKFYAYLKKTHPHILDITELRTYVSDTTGYVNNNPARSLATFSGGKHGYTDEANRTFVGSFTLPDGNTRGIVLLKSSDLLHDIDALLTYGS